MSTAILFYGVFAIFLIYGIFLYNNLVNIKHNVAKSWSNIDVLLKQRHDELPKLVEACKQYSQFEQETLRQVTEAARPAGGRCRPGARMPGVRSPVRSVL